ncbi:MAG: glycosyltransferase [Bacteroidetes bacterium]|nr:glycosyltransferase [Bacteroidota bacterium]
MQEKTLLIIGTVWPEPASSAAGSRMLQLMEVFRQQGYAITFASAAADSEFSVNLDELNIRKKSIELNSNSFDALVKELDPAVVLFDRFMCEEQFGWRVAENCPAALRILDTEDLHCLRYGRQSAWKEKRAFAMSDLLSDHAKREVASIYRCDLSLIISSYEMELLQNHFKVEASLLLYLPFMQGPVETARWKGFEERSDFITIGNFLHEPNWNSVLYLKENIWTMIRKQLPEAALRVYGAYPSQKVTALHNPKEGFYIMGRAEDAQEVIGQARVLLAPLRYGAGLKGKLMDAMLCGTPNVTTAIGAEGMQGGLEWSGLVADTAPAIAAAAVKLYTDKNLWEQSRQNGIAIIHTLFRKEEHEERLCAAVSALQKDLEAHRAANFTGAMLMHHTISGTKYMAKWIEEKNKK